MMTVASTVENMLGPRWSGILLLAAILSETVLSSIIIVENVDRQCRPCYRRLLSGKKILETHVRRAIECERISDCNRACDYEKYFVCEGFNYRRAGPGSRGMCELTSTAYPRMDIQRDFAADPQCDFYERDFNCQRGGDSNARPQWWSKYPSTRPEYGPPRAEYGPPARRPSNGPTRPFGYDRHPMDYDQPAAAAFPPSLPRPRPGDRRPPAPEFYPERPPDRFYDRPYPHRYPEDGFDQRDYGRPYPKYPDRRVDPRPYPDIGTNEIGPYLPDNRKDPNRSWRDRVTGVTYGGSYGYGTSNAGGYDVSKPPPKRPQKRPYENENFYGEFYNYGGAFGYGDSYPPTSRDQVYGGTGKGQECSIRAAAGFKLARPIIGKSFLTPNVDHCESLCTNEKAFPCLTFAYRYNVESSDPTDNCLLGQISYRDLNFYTDLEPDRNYDIYAIVGDAKTCSMKKPTEQRPPPDECFWRVRSGFGMPTDVTKKTMTVDGLGDCQAQCTTAQEFTCRSFAYRYGSQGREKTTDSNCYLSDWPSQEINPANMPDMDGAELYERGSYGRGCEPYPFSLMSPGRLADNQPPAQRDESCYSGYHRPCKLTPYAVLLSMKVASETDCRQKCSRMRERDSIPCMSFSFKVSGNGRDDNCLLSDVPIRDLRPGLDYTYDDNHVMYAWKELDPHCGIPGYLMDDDHVYGPNNGFGQGLGRPLYIGPGSPNAEGRPGVFGAGRPPSPAQGQRPQDDHYYQGGRPDPVAPYGPGGPSRPGEYGNYGGSAAGGYPPSGGGYPPPGGGYPPPGAGYPDYGNVSPYPDDLSTFNHYSVNGYPCKRGTRCERNKIAGFWSCETEGSEYGSWDYCCQPQHQCGYSQGFNYPWCYVGQSEDQWRPCSEKYYPYLPGSQRPQRPPIGGPYGNNDDRRVYYGDRDPYSGRHWPIIYLHREPPPNSTDSVASAASSTSTTEMRSLNFTTTTVLPTEQTPENKTEEEQSSRLRRIRRLRSRTISNDDNASTLESAGEGTPEISRKLSTRIIALRSNNRERAGKVERIFKTAATRPKNGANPPPTAMSATPPSSSPVTTEEYVVRPLEAPRKDTFVENNYPKNTSNFFTLPNSTTSLL